jgi:hypothetical protein
MVRQCPVYLERRSTKNRIVRLDWIHRIKFDFSYELYIQIFAEENDKTIESDDEKKRKISYEIQ